MEADAQSPAASVGAGTSDLPRAEEVSWLGRASSLASPSEGKLPEPNFAILHGTTSKPPNLPVPYSGLWADFLTEPRRRQVPPVMLRKPLQSI